MPFEESLNRYWYGAKEDPDPDNFRRTNINNCLSYFYSLNEVNKLIESYMNMPMISSMIGLLDVAQTQ